MQSEMRPTMATLLRVLNNNAIMVDATGGRLILLGRGIGFSKQLGDEVLLSAATEIFQPSSPQELRQLADFVVEIPLETFNVARRAVDHAEATAGVRPSQALLLSIADHLHYAVLRAEKGMTIDFPLKWEIAQLYPRESELGRATVHFARTELGVPIAEDEGTAFAMHFVNAQFAQADVSQTVEMTKLLGAAVDIVKEGIGPHATADPMSVARFVTHLRYLYVRISKDNQIESAPPVLVSALHEAHPEVGIVADQVRQLIESGGGKLTEAEVSYLEIHVARLATAVRN